MRTAVARLGELATAQYGSALKEADRNGAGHFTVFGSSGAVGRHDKALVDHPTIVIGRKGSVGEVTYAPEGGWPIDTTYYLEVKEPGRTDLRYLYWALSRAGLGCRAITTSIPGLNRDELYRTKIPLPPLAEQRRIAAVLDKADGVRRKRRESSRLLDEFLRSAFLEMFGDDPVRNEKGWEVVRLGELLLRPLRNGLSPAKGGMVRGQVLTLTAITGSRFDNSAVKTANFAHAPSPDRLVEEVDFLICRGNGNLSLMGRGRFPHDIRPGTVFPDTMIAARLDRSRVVPAYLEAVWQGSGIRRQVESAGRTTSGIHKVNQQVLLSIVLPLPTMELQHRFQKITDKVARLTSRLSDRSVEHLFDSLAQQVFGGRS